MSIEIVYYPERATRADLKRHLISLGFRLTSHLWEWPKGSVHYHWFEERDYLSFDGVEATIFPVGAEDSDIPTPLGWALHTRVRSSGSSFDRAQQNHVIRTARKQFGGTFINDWYGRNRYTKVEKDSRGPEERGLFLLYERVNQDVEAVMAALPKPLIELPEPLTAFAQADPARVLYNALIPFAVAALEYFFGETFRILLRYDADTVDRFHRLNKRIDIQDAMALADGRLTVEDIIAGSYSFQSINSIHKAFQEWLNIDFWTLIRRRRRVGQRVVRLQQRLDQIIESRHGVIHRFEFNRGLQREDLQDILATSLTLIETLVDYLEQDRNLHIKDETRKKPSRSRPILSPSTTETE